MKSLRIRFPEKNVITTEETDVPQIGPDEILCKAEKSLVSMGTEMTCLKGQMEADTNWDAWVRFPFTPGYSMASRVVAIGSQVEGIHIGDRIASLSQHEQFFALKRDKAHLIPDGVSSEDATWLALGAYVAQLGVRRAELELGQTVGIVGMGILGQLVTQYLHLMGCRKVICIDPVQSRLDIAKESGATHMLAMDAGAAKAAVEDITDGKMLDVVFDITGHPAAFAPTTMLVRKLGKVILLGDADTPSKQFLGPRVLCDSISILAIHGTMYPQHESAFNPWTTKEMTSLFFEYVMQGRMNVSRLISHRFSPLQAPQVYKQLQQDRGAYLGVIFDWNKIRDDKKGDRSK